MRQVQLASCQHERAAEQHEDLAQATQASSPEAGAQVCAEPAPSA
jgi:hypothetical protein